MTRPVRDRRRDGERRTSAEPLAAKWRPTDEPPSGRRRAVRRRKGVVATYGWRLYAVPILLAVTALVLVQTVNDKDAGGSATPGENTAAGTGDGDVYSGGPKITEKPASKSDPNIPTADLPGGPDYLQAGPGTFTVVPGTTGRLGNGGKLYTYTVEIEDGIDLAPYGGVDSFGRLVDSTLGDPRGWAATGQVSVQRVDGDADPDIRFTLGTPDTLHRPDYCGYSIKYESSCWRRSEKRVMINLARWVRGALAFGGDIGSYREYAINHEIGHAFGRGHVGCGEEGGLAPVMMQQSFGTANNYVAQLNEQAGNDDPVQADGKTCRFNQWPNPQAQPPT